MIITQCLKSYDINAYDQDRDTPLHSIVIYEEPELCRLLCERGDVDVDKGNKYIGNTAIHEAASNGRMECMRILLDVGKADIDALSLYLWTALHSAALHCNLEAAALLIERGAKVNLVDRYGGTPLDLAHQTNQDRTEMIALLKSKGAKRASELPQPST